MKKMNKKGFTLVEIMIVVAIIGLLAAIGIPSFSKARANSIEKSKENNVRIVNAAIEEYALDQGLDDGASIQTADYLAFVKGGSAALNVGSQTASPDVATVGTDATVSSLYD